MLGNILDKWPGYRSEIANEKYDAIIIGSGISGLTNAPIKPVNKLNKINTTPYCLHIDFKKHHTDTKNRPRIIRGFK